MNRPIAVVTGGGSGIGRATAGRLRRDGFVVAVLDVDGSAAADAGDLGIATDVADAASVSAAFAEVENSLGRIELLVANAGITGSAEATRLHETPPNEWDRVIAVNVRGPYLCSRAALPSMIRQGRGHIIIVASVAGMVPFPGRAAYSTSKGAALTMARSIAVDYAVDGIRANAVCPGMTETPMTRWRLDQPELRADIEARIPMGRVASPVEIADAIGLLASPASAYITGHGLVVDGGWTAW